MFTSMIWSVLSRRNLINKEFWNKEVKKSCNVGEELTHIGFVEFQYRSGNFRPSLLGKKRSAIMKGHHPNNLTQQPNTPIYTNNSYPHQNVLYQPQIYFLSLPGVKTMDQGKKNQCDHLVTSDMLGPALLNLATYNLPSDFAVMFTWSLGVSQSFQHKLGVTVDLTN